MCPSGWRPSGRGKAMNADGGTWGDSKTWAMRNHATEAEE